VRLFFFLVIAVRTWEKLGNSVSIRRGPLWFSLKIEEEWKRYGGTDTWPAFEILPASPWNYGLVLDPRSPEATIMLAGRKQPAEQPFTAEAAPVILKARAKRLPSWKAEGRMAGRIPSGPVVSAEPEEEVTLIPMGCARLRIASFPLVAGK